MTERWSEKDKTRRGHYTLKVHGHPVTVSAEMRLQPDPRGGCTYTVVHSVKATIPLLGRKIEQFILEQTERSIGKKMPYRDEFSILNPDTLRELNGARDSGRIEIPSAWAHSLILSGLFQPADHGNPYQSVIQWRPC